MLRQLKTIAYYTLLEALRNRLMWMVGLVALIGIALSSFLNQLAITESRQIQIALLATFLRFAAVFLLATFVITSLVREFNDKGLELVLALPLPRAGYALGKLTGFAVLALIPAVLFGLITSFFAPWLQSLHWTLCLLFELWIIAAFSLLCVFSFNQIMAALAAVIAFYCLSRSIAALQLMSNGPLAGMEPSQQYMDMVIGWIAAVMPNLDQFTRTEWLLYHTASWQTLLPLLAQTAIYLLLLGAAAVVDLYRKNI